MSKKSTEIVSGKKKRGIVLDDEQVNGLLGMAAEMERKTPGLALDLSKMVRIAIAEYLEGRHAAE